MIDIERLDFTKFENGLIPAIIQETHVGKVLMLGFMNYEAIQKSIETKKVTFFSRTKKRLWTKGETSQNFLHIQKMFMDCDQDSLLIEALPAGPTCHLGRNSCFDSDASSFLFSELEAIIRQRKESGNEHSYVYQLFQKGIDRIAQKVGEEAVETVIEAKNNDPQKFLEEASDLIFHLMVLLEKKGHNLKDILQTLKKRNTSK